MFRLLSHHKAFQKNRSNVSRFIVQSGIPNAYTMHYTGWA